MKKSLAKIQEGYEAFRKKYALGDASVMQSLAYQGQQPEIMLVACCDARVDPALILQCDPGDLFVVRNVANIIPPYEKDEAHHGTSAALEFGIRFLQVKHLILLGHSQCGGIQALMNPSSAKTDFIHHWVSLIQKPEDSPLQEETCAKFALHQSYENCFTFPWIQEKVQEKKLSIHRWFFDIQHGKIFAYDESRHQYIAL